MPQRPTVLCYYFPNYHPTDGRNTLIHGPGWSEWELVKRATPRFIGHQPPPQPAWGYPNEANPVAMAQKIDAAADHGIDGFIFDWYYYDDGPFLERALEEGFLPSANVDRMKFCCMWANHDWNDIHPTLRSERSRTLYPGVITPATWDRLTDLVIARYFSHPSHLLVDDKPYFSIYELSKLLASFGSIAATRKALDLFRTKAERAGHPGLHLNTVVWGQPILPDEKAIANPEKLVADLGFDSFASYVWIHHGGLAGTQPTVPYRSVQENYFRYWDQALTKFDLPYIPNVTMGWDSSPRTIQSDIWEPDAGYPYTSVITGNTPAAFQDAVAATRDRLANLPGHMNMLTLNAWNEWTEGSYLEPDQVHGMAYLEAIRDAVGHTEQTASVQN